MEIQCVMCHLVLVPCIAPHVDDVFEFNPDLPEDDVDPASFRRMVN